MKGLREYFACFFTLQFWRVLGATFFGLFYLRHSLRDRFWTDVANEMDEQENYAED